MLISQVKASPYYVTSETYFPIQKGGPYITLNSSLLPLSFNILYQDAEAWWHFNSYKIKTTVDLTLQHWPLVINRWINYSVSGAGTQQFYAVLEFYQLKVFFNGVEQSSGFSHENYITTVTTTGITDVWIWFSPSGGGIPTEPEENETNGGIPIMPQTPEEIIPETDGTEIIPEPVAPSINPVLALCIFFAVVIVIISAYHQKPSLKSSRKKFAKREKEKKPKWKKENPWK